MSSNKKYAEFKEINYARLAEETLDFWKQNEVFEQSISSREGNPSFTFFEGPPSANGTPGIHHVMARTIKDVFCRFKTLQGFQVKRKGGWDTHGLPVELQVEKELGITKEDIGKKISVAEYNQKCRETVMKFKAQWDELTEKMGYWVDLKDPYITYDSKYIESCWYLLKELYNKSLLYKGYTIQPYSPAAGTGLSSHEVNQPGAYRDVKDTTVVAQFKANAEGLKGLQKFAPINGDAYFLAWTTTPWTLPSNSALAVGENIDYALVKSFNPYTFEPVNVVLAKDLVGKYFSEKAKEIALEDFKTGDKLIPWKVIAEFKGRDIVGIEYEPLLSFPEVKVAAGAFRVIPGDYVSTSDGTGIVHIAPTFGADDARVAKAAGVPAVTVLDADGNEVPLVDKRGRFVVEVIDDVMGLSGEYVKEEYLTDAEKETERLKQEKTLVAKGVVAKVDKYMTIDERIALKLKLDNRAFKVEKYEHSYPHCWRTDKPILYYPLDSWFIRTTAVKDRLVELNKTINWKPESTGTGRFGNWLENLVDWNLSRSRYWGTPLPIWRTEDGKQEKCIGSVEELQKEIAKAKAAGIKTGEHVEDLHRPYVDEIVLVSDNGQPMRRETDLIDVWFDSGAMPYAQWHYPFENKELIDNNEAYPADFISEGVDQTRGWFFTLHAISGMVFDKIAFKNVVSTGLVLDKNGEKMSKRKGNVINPFETLDKYGPDATRWYMISNANPWDNLKFDLDGIMESQRKLFNTLYNTYNFYALYANLDGFVPLATNAMPVKQRNEFDQWIISELNSLIKTVTESYEDYDVTRAARAIEDFTAELLSNWYVRLSRRRFWKGELSEDKRAAYETLFECLSVVTQLMSPIAPFFSEWMYKNLTGPAREAGEKLPASVHLTNLVKADESLINPALSKSMLLAQKACSLIHSVRKAKSLRVRLPLAKVYINVLDQEQFDLLSRVESLITEETNVKLVEKFDSKSGGSMFTKSVLPDLKRLGKAMGPRINELKQKLNDLSQEDILKIETSGLELTFADASMYTLTREDVLVKTTDAVGLASASDGNVTVALDTNISPELRNEGIARDFVNRIQNMRKDTGMTVQDKIRIYVAKKDELIDAALLANSEYICRETQALGLTLEESVSDATAVDMDEFELSVKIEK